MFYHKIKELSTTDPDRIALMHKKDITFTYKELWDRSTKMGYYLLKHFDEKRPVAIVGDKEFDVVSAIYGAIMARKPYVVIPDYYPPKRRAFIFSDSNADCVILATKLNIDDCDLPIMDPDFFDRLEETIPEGFSFDDENYDLDKMALMIYTSGSTGEPKGVMLSYRNLLMSLNRTKGHFTAFARDTRYNRSMNLSSFAFCASYGFPYTIGDGGGVYACVPRKDMGDLNSLFQYFIDIQPTGFLCTPSLVEKLLTIKEFNENDIPTLNVLSIGGEAFSIDLYHRLKARFPSLHLINGYGMTECLSVCTYYHVVEEDLDEGENYLPVGLVEGSHIMLIDQNGNQILEDNQQGEVVVFGDVVGKGYLNQPELTQKAFYRIEDGTPAFRTHDLAVMRKGKYYFIGRQDHQVKIGGNRVELAEVEANIKKCSIVRDCAAAVKNEPETSLVAFIVLNKDGTSMKQAEAYFQIKKELKAFVESFMIPRKIVFLDDLPKNINAKIDRSLLSEWAQKED